jgi:hypothetical protein
MGAMAAKFSHETMEAALAKIAKSNRQMVASERQRNRDYDTNMASLGGRHSRVEQMFLDVSERIGLVGAESSALVVLSKDVRTVVSDSMATVLRTMAVNDQKYRDLCAETDQKNQEAWAAFELRASEMHEMNIKRVGDTSKSIIDMQVKLQSSFDRMKYLEKMSRLIWRIGSRSSLRPSWIRHLHRLSQRCWPIASFPPLLRFSRAPWRIFSPDLGLQIALCRRNMCGN